MADNSIDQDNDHDHPKGKRLVIEFTFGQLQLLSELLSFGDLLAKFLEESNSKKLHQHAKIWHSRCKTVRSILYENIQVIST